MVKLSYILVVAIPLKAGPVTTWGVELGWLPSISKPLVAIPLKAGPVTTERLNGVEKRWEECVAIPLKAGPVTTSGPGRWEDISLSRSQSP